MEAEKKEKSWEAGRAQVVALRVARAGIKAGILGEAGVTTTTTTTESKRQ